MASKHSIEILQTGSRYAGRKCPVTRTELKPGERFIVCHKNDEAFSWAALPDLRGRCPYCGQQINLEQIIDDEDEKGRSKKPDGFSPSWAERLPRVALIVILSLGLMGICSAGAVLGYRQFFAPVTAVPTIPLTAQATETPTAMEPTATLSSAIEASSPTDTPRSISTLRPTPTEEPSPTPMPSPMPTSSPQPIVTFWDSFDGPDIDTSKWNLDIGTGDIVASGGVLRMASSGRRYPYISSRYDPFPLEGNFQISFHFRYSEVKVCGVGVIMTSYLVPVGLTQDEAANRQREAEANGVQAGVWQDETNGMQLWFRSGADRVDLPISGPNTDWNELTIKCLGNQYTLYLNGSPVYTSFETPYRPQGIWIGHPAELSTDCQWSTLEIDYIKVESLP